MTIDSTIETYENLLRDYQARKRDVGGLAANETFVSDRQAQIQMLRRLIADLKCAL